MNSRRRVNSNVRRLPLIGRTVLINGVHIIFILPPILLVLLAVAVGVWRFSTGGLKRGLVSTARILVYGGFALFVLFCGLIVFYYATGGH